MLLFLSLSLGQNPGLPDRFQVNIYENLGLVQQLLAEIPAYFRESEAEKQQREAAELEQRRRVEEDRLRREREEQKRQSNRGRTIAKRKRGRRETTFDREAAAQTASALRGSGSSSVSGKCRKDCRI
jgi:hypothetical protein